MNFDWTINPGHLIMALGFLLTLGTYRERLNVITQKLSQIETELRAASLGALNQRVATLEQEQNRMRDRLHDISNFVHTLQKP